LPAPLVAAATRVAARRAVAAATSTADGPAPLTTRGATPVGSGWRVAALAVVPAGAAAVVVLAALAVFVGGTEPPPAAPSRLPGVDPVVLAAYTHAAAAAGQLSGGCRLRWSLLAGIGEVESGNAAGHTITPAGQVTPPILGPVLDGSGAGGNTAPIADADGGRLDGNTRYDRAISLLQLLPATWTAYARDANGDHRADPGNAYDAAATATAYLCAARPGADLTDPAQARAAAYRYNGSADYVTRVLGAADRYDQLALNAAGAPIPAGPVAAAAVRVAVAQLGKPYQWGAIGPDAFDCSGLTGYAYAQAGLRLPRTSREQYAAGPRVGDADTGLSGLRPGDLLFWAYDPADPGTIHHVALYTGGTQIIEAATTGTPVRRSAFYPDGYIGAIRPTQGR
jgi:cell wall-associated NlpC family hydrolase